MTSRRVLKAAESIRKIVSTAINTELRDPRVGMVTVTHIGLSADMRHAVVKISVMGDETKAKLTLGGLRSAAGFLQSKIAKGLDMRYTPRLSFEIDDGIKKQLAMAALLREVLPDAEGAPSDAARPEDAPSDDAPHDEFEGDAGEEFADDHADDADEPEDDDHEDDAEGDSSGAASDRTP